MRVAMTMMVVGLFAGLSTMPVLAQDAAAACPAAKMAPPDYPADAVRAARQGTAVVEARVDDCGRVLEARIKTRTRHADLNNAALAAAQASILPPGKRNEAVDGWIAWPIDFKVDSSLVSRPVDWPRTHRKTRFVIDTPLGPDASVAALKTQMLEMQAGVVRPPVLPLRHAFRQVQGEQGIEFWLFIADGDNVDKLAMRYRPVMEEGKPVVRMAMHCEFPVEDCDGIQKLLAERGLPMARPVD